MTPREAALARVTRLGATGLRPALSGDEVENIVDSYLLPDLAGLLPAAPGYVPTYDTNAAIAEVWAQKAAVVAADFDFKADDAEYSKGDVLAHMLAMEAKYLQMVVPVDLSGRTTSGAGTWEVGGTNSRRTNPLDALALKVIP